MAKKSNKNVFLMSSLFLAHAVTKLLCLSCYRLKYRTVFTGVDRLPTDFKNNSIKSDSQIKRGELLIEELKTAH